jgi:hypothetical protein
MKLIHCSQTPNLPDGIALTLFDRAMPPHNKGVHSNGAGRTPLRSFAEIASDHKIRLTSEDAIDQIL